ncbi:hypothetical protein C0J52_05187 [Blattella germanica]|nr:hypothetical protein C0J52_05187 [Blattella germanica]
MPETMVWDLPASGAKSVTVCDARVFSIAINHCHVQAQKETQRRNEMTFEKPLLSIVFILMMKLLLFYFVVAISLNVGQGEDYCLARDDNPYLYFSTVTAYETVRGQSTDQVLIPQCEPAQFWLLSRHGTRYPDAVDITAMWTLPEIRDQTFQTVDEELAIPQGYNDLHAMAKRFKSRFPTLLNQSYSPDKFEVRFTNKQRTTLTATAFVDGLFGSTSKVRLPEPLKKDKIIRPYKACDKWTNEVDENPDILTERNLFEQGPYMMGLITNVSQRLGFEDDLSIEQISAMQSACSFEKAWRLNEVSPWCAAFSKDDLEIWEYYNDLKYYYNTGYGIAMNKDVACPPVKDFLDRFSNIENGEQQPGGVLYFTHASMLQLVLTPLGIAEDSEHLTHSNFEQMRNRKWRTSFITPFATNLAVVFFRCEDDSYKVQFYLGEHLLNFEGCNEGLCDWSYIKDKFGSISQDCFGGDLCCKDLENLRKWNLDTDRTIPVELAPQGYDDLRNLAKRRLAFEDCEAWKENAHKAEQQMIEYDNGTQMTMLRKNQMLLSFGVGKDKHHLSHCNYNQMKNRRWRTSKLIPFAANLVAVFFRCDKGEPFLVQFYFNEQPMEVEGCENGLCDWTMVLSYFLLCAGVVVLSCALAVAERCDMCKCSVANSDVLQLNCSDLRTRPGDIPGLIKLPYPESYSVHQYSVVEAEFERNRIKLLSRFSIEDLTKLSLAHNEISSIDAGTFMWLKYLKVISLADNRIETLNAKSFQGLPKLEELDLSRNKLQNFSQDTFVDLKRLSTLSLSHNMLSNVNWKMFPSSVRSLDLSCNAIVRIEAGSSASASGLVALDLSDNNITSIGSHALAVHSSLTRLDLSRNKIVKVDSAAFAKQSSLSTLVLSHNRLEEVLGSTEFPATLRVLDLSHNLLSDLSAPVASLKKLQELYLQKNALTEVRLASNTTLKVLNVSGNAVSSFSGALCPNLEVLDLSYNQLPDVPSEVQGSAMPKLRWLSLDANPMQQVRFTSTTTTDDDERQTTATTTKSLVNLQWLSLSHLPQLQELKERALSAGPELQRVVVSGRGLDGLGVLATSGPPGQPLGLLLFPAVGPNPHFATCNSPSRLRNRRLVHFYKWETPALCSRMEKLVQEPTTRSDEVHVTMGFSGPMLAVVICLASVGLLLVVAAVVLQRRYDRRYKIRNRRIMADARLLLLSIVLAGHFLRVASGVCPKACDCPNHVTVNCSNRDLKSFDPRVFYPQEIRSSQLLLLDGNGLVTLHKDTFFWLGKLRTLHLHNNRLVSPQLGTFSEQRNLEELSLHQNKLKLLHVDLFDKLWNLQILSLQQNNMEIIDNGTFSSLIRLKCLNLSHNELTSLDKGLFDSQKKLETLDLSFNKINSIPIKMFHSLRTLIKLNLNNNNISLLHALLFDRLEKLEHLSLHHNKICSFGVSSLHLNSLKSLELSFNHFVTLTKEMFSKVPRLASLFFMSNNITVLESGAFDLLGDLELLHLDANRLLDIPRGLFSQLKNLRTLSLKYNLLEIIEPHILNGLKHILQLDVSHNNITSFNLAQTEQSKLQNLNVKNNFIKTIGVDAFKNLTELKELNFNYNSIETLDRHLFRNQSKLEVFLVRNNSLQTISTDTVKPLAALKELDLAGNPLACDCELKKTWFWLTKHKVRHSGWCHTPEAARGASWNVTQILTCGKPTTSTSTTSSSTSNTTAPKTTTTTTTTTTATTTATPTSTPSCAASTKPLTAVAFILLHQISALFTHRITYRGSLH